MDAGRERLDCVGFGQTRAPFACSPMARFHNRRNLLPPDYANGSVAATDQFPRNGGRRSEPDAYLAAFAIEMGFHLATLDRGMGR